MPRIHKGPRFVYFSNGYLMCKYNMRDILFLKKPKYPTSKHNGNPLRVLIEVPSERLRN